MPDAPAPARMLRLFVALWPQAAERAALAAWQQEWHWPARASRVKPDKLHLTLHFLGDIAAERLPALVTGIRLPFEPFELQFGGGEVWPGGIAVLRPQATPPPLRQLHSELADALRALELPVETRQFRAHVTLARRAAGALAPLQGLDLTWRADQGYVLVRSVPGKGYEVLERFG